MENQIAWQEGVARVEKAFRALSPAEVIALRGMVARLKEFKTAMQALVERVEAGSHCAACRGACCVCGRYHFRASDLLVYLVSEEPLFTPLFDNGVCPFLAGERCLMPPAYRPFNCITFNCETIEDLLPEEDRLLFYRWEGELRVLYRAIDALLPDRSLRGALLGITDSGGSPPAASPEYASLGSPAPLSMQCTE